MKPLEIITGPDHIVAFIDILGFKEMINEYKAGNTKLFFILQRKIELAFSILDKENHGQKQQEEYLLFKEQLNYKSFSDCICITVPTKIRQFSFLEIIRLFLTVISAFQMALLEVGDECYFIRGGISVGDYYEDQNMIFSSALVEAYQLESKDAIVPRIIISKKLHEIILAQLPGNLHLESPYPLIIKFEDDLPFINFLNADLLEAYLADKEVKAFHDKLKIDGIMNSETFVESSIKSKVRRINNILKRILEGMSTKIYSQEVINKHSWMIRFLKKELEKSL